MNKLIAALGIAATLATAAPAMAQSVVPTAGYGYATASYAQPFCPGLSYNLYIGLSDYYTQGQVSVLQQYLAARGYYQPVTGYFGAITRANVAQLQRTLGVYPVTGGVGPLTRAAVARGCGGGVVVPPSAQAPVIYSVTPSAGPVGTTVTIAGSNFGTSNTVYFGSGGTQNVPSYNGTTIVYTIPSSIGAVCAAGQLCPQYLQLVTPGAYNLSVGNGYGQSGWVPFTVTQTGSVGGVTVTSPAAGQTYNRGQDMTITWGYPVTPNSTQMMLELYSASGSRIGLIAVSQSTSGSYTWHIPGYPQNYLCTMQYPNGLCGTAIPDGQYYLKVSASNDPLDATPTVIASGVSGTFTMAGAGGSGQYSVTATPASGAAPLTTSFTVSNYTGSYFVNYGDGTSASLVSGQTAHTYYNRGTYTATFTSDYACLHSTPACQLAQQNLGSATVTVY